MTKSQLIERIAQQAPHIPPRRIEAIVNAVFEQMTESLRTGERIELRGFGCFTVKTRRARLARNPKTGESVSVPRRVALAFAAGKELRERINRAPEPPAPAAPPPAALPLTLEPVPQVLAAQPRVAGEVSPRI
jgi:integration host factor subunit beta